MSKWCRKKKNGFASSSIFHLSTPDASPGRFPFSLTPMCLLWNWLGLAGYVRALATQARARSRKATRNFMVVREWKGSREASGEKRRGRGEGEKEK